MRKDQDKRLTYADGIRWATESGGTYRFRRDVSGVSLGLFVKPMTGMFAGQEVYFRGVNSKTGE
jgi:hypothetical protein